jgi:hypothetical protein
MPSGLDPHVAEAALVLLALPIAGILIRWWMTSHDERLAAVETQSNQQDKSIALHDQRFGGLEGRQDEFEKKLSDVSGKVNYLSVKDKLAREKKGNE